MIFVFFCLNYILSHHLTLCYLWHLTKFLVFFFSFFPSEFGSSGLILYSLFRGIFLKFDCFSLILYNIPWCMNTTFSLSINFWLTYRQFPSCCEWSSKKQGCTTISVVSAGCHSPYQRYSKWLLNARSQFTRKIALWWICLIQAKPMRIQTPNCLLFCCIFGIWYYGYGVGISPLPYCNVSISILRGFISVDFLEDGSFLNCIVYLSSKMLATKFDV